MWPLDELTAETIRERWGAGNFRICWFTQDPTNEDPGQRLRAEGTGHVFGIDADPAEVARERAPVVAAQAPASSLPREFTQAFELMAIFDAKAGSQLERTMQAAAAMAQGARGGGLDAQTLMLIMNQQQQQQAQMMATLQAQHVEQMNILRASLEQGDDEDEDDEHPSAVANAAAAVAKPFFKRNQDLKSAVMNYATENPAELFELLKGVPGVLATVSNLMKQSVAPPPPPSPAVAAPALPERPRARIVTPERAPAPGLNSLFTEPAQTRLAVAEAPAPAPVPAVVEVPSSAAAE